MPLLLVNNNFYEKLEIGDDKLHEGSSSHRRCSVKKGVFRDFGKPTGKHLCQSLFF